MVDTYGYERYEEPYSYEVRDRRVRIARGLQAVDGLTTSATFDVQAKRYVEGEIDTAELREIVDAYYDQKIGRAIDRYSQEADLVAARICELLDSNGFVFAPFTLQSIHERLFRGLMEEPFYERNFRDYNFSKREFVLARESVDYGDCAQLQRDLEDAFAAFTPASYHEDDIGPYCASMAGFVAQLWQIHPFAEGNTRTVAVFLLKMLRSHGFSGVTNELFEHYSLHFRNALVRACYRNARLGVESDATYLNTFMECLLRNDAAYPYRNRDMAVPELFAAKGMLPPQADGGRVGGIL